MSNHDEFIQSILDQFLELKDQLDGIDLLGNSVFDYLLTAVYFVAVFFGSYIVKYVFLSKLKDRFAKDEEQRSLIKLINKSIRFPLIIVFSFYLSILHLTMNETLELVINTVIYAIFAYYLYKFSMNFFDYAMDKQPKLDRKENEHIVSFITILTNTFVISIILLWFLSNLGINITGLIAGLGVLGIALGFGLQSIVEDLFASITIYMDKPFEIGDTVVINSVRGTVEKIGIRSTHIRSTEGHLVVMSNQNLTDSDINNYKKMRRRRVKQTIGVGCDTPVDVLREIPNMLRERLNDIENIRVDTIVLDELSNYSWNYDIFYYIRRPDMATFRNVKQEANFRILELMEENNIELPYPITEVVMRGNEINT